MKKKRKQEAKRLIPVVGKRNVVGKKVERFVAGFFFFPQQRQKKNM